MATHSSVLAWRIPGTGEPGGLPSMGSRRVRHDWSDLAAASVVWWYCFYHSLCWDFSFEFLLNFKFHSCICWCFIALTFLGVMLDSCMGGMLVSFQHWEDDGFPMWLMNQMGSCSGPRPAFPPGSWVSFLMFTQEWHPNPLYVLPLSSAATKTKSRDFSDGPMVRTPAANARGMGSSLVRELRSHMLQFSSVAQSYLSLCKPKECSMPGLPVHHQLPEVTQTHIHQVSDAIQPSHPLSSPSPPTFNLFQHQGLFKWVTSSHQVAEVLEFQLQHQSFQWIFRTDFL